MMVEAAVVVVVLVGLQEEVIFGDMAIVLQQIFLVHFQKVGRVIVLELMGILDLMAYL